MSLVVNFSAISSSSHGLWNTKAVVVPRKQESSSKLSSPSLASAKRKKGNGFRVRAFIFDPTQERILKEALKEPVAFLGGVFAGVLRLDLNEDPLKEWVTRTVEAAGITEEELNAADVQQEETPQEIQIE